MSMTMEDLETDFEEAKGTGRTAGKIDDLPDGEYVFEISSGDAMETNSGPLVKLKLMIFAPGSPHDGGKIDRDYWLTEKDRDTGDRVKSTRNIDLLKKDLKTLGFDCENWTRGNNRPFSVELDRAMGVISGVRFHGKKSSKPKDNKPGESWHNLYVNARVKDDGRPAAFGPAELAGEPDPFG